MDFDSGCLNRIRNFLKIQLRIRTLVSRTKFSLLTRLSTTIVLRLSKVCNRRDFWIPPNFCQKKCMHNAHGENSEDIQ